MKMRLVAVRLALVGLAAGSALGAVAQTQPAALSAYKVPSVYLPPLKRPAVRTVDSATLTRIGAGFMPATDGAPLHLNLRRGTTAKNAEAAQALVVNTLRQGGLTGDFGTVQPAGNARTNSGLRDNRKAADLTKKYEDDFRTTQQKKLGKFSNATIAEMKNTQGEMARTAQSGSTVYAFGQVFKGTPVENARLALVVRSTASASLSGNFFSAINPTNGPRLQPDAAVRAAAKYVSAHAKAGGRIGAAPVLVLVPYEAGFRYAWRLDIGAEDGPYRAWVDAENGSILQFLPQFFYDSARGLAFNPNPTAGTTEMQFEVDAPSGGNYRLKLTGQLEVTNNGADGVTSSALTIPAGSSGEANFNASPWNGTAVERTSVSGYNSRFQEINAFAWIYRVRQLADTYGSQPLPAFTAKVNLGGQQNAFADGRFYVCNATLNASTSCNDIFNAANDATVLAHEYGHNINGLQYGVSGGNMTGSINEGLADFWSCTIHNTDIFAGWWAHNCPTPVQSGFAPRQCEANDVFPRHRTMVGASAEVHSDGQMICWAMWNMRQEFNAAGALGIFATNADLMKAMTTAGLGLADGISDKAVHDSYVDLERQLVANSGTTWMTEKILASFARAGLFLSGTEAIIDINDDYLAHSAATPPTFTVWTGRDYTFNTSNAVVLTGSLPYNPQYQVEVANNAAFTSNFSTSGWLTNVTTNQGGTATWALPAAMWTTLKGGAKLYYRVRTRRPCNVVVACATFPRISTNTGDNTLLNMNPPYAVINNSGECECSCSTNTTTNGGVKGAAAGMGQPASLAVFAIPLLYALYRRRKAKAQAAAV